MHAGDGITALFSQGKHNVHILPVTFHMNCWGEDNDSISICQMVVGSEALK